MPIETATKCVGAVISRIKQNISSYGHPKYYILVMYIQGFPSDCVSRKIPGVTQDDDVRHEGNTAVVTV